MKPPSVQVRRWVGDEPPQEADIKRMLAEQGLSGYHWSNAPGDTYAAHAHRTTR